MVIMTKPMYCTATAIQVAVSQGIIRYCRLGWDCQLQLAERNSVSSLPLVW
jgi:hypothetical protein